MQYRKNPKNTDELSILGFGCLRLPKKNHSIDQEKTEELLEDAVKRGINYIDTSYLYTGSEAALGKFLEKGYRDRVYLATKLPYRQCKSAEDAETIFTEQKERLGTEYIDYYLLHMLSDTADFEKCRESGLIRWLEEKKQAGEIRNIGFSYHGNTPEFKRILDSYPWDFCQIQVNYFDDAAQAGVAGLKYAGAAGIPVIIMEPLRGGALSRLPAEAQPLLETERPGCSPAEFSFRWLWNFPEVTCVLSGMNGMEQIAENTAAADRAEAGSLTESDLSLYRSVKEILNAQTAIPCTGCSYCMPCPHGVDIPLVFDACNRGHAEGFKTGLIVYITCAAMKERPAVASRCRKCGLCEKKCPQHLPVMQYLDTAKKELEGVPYHVVSALVKAFPGFLRRLM